MFDLLGTTTLVPSLAIDTTSGVVYSRFFRTEPLDKQAYESSLDRQVVAWPTHFVAATKDFAQELENELLDAMQQEKGWSLSGNFAVMVWLAKQLQLSKDNVATTEQVRDILTANELNNHLLLNLTGSH